MRSLCGKYIKPVLMLQHLENVKRAALAQVAVASQNEVFGSSLAAHLSSLSEGLPRAKEEFSASLADLANTHPQDVCENQIYEVFLKGRTLVPIKLDHMRRPTLLTWHLRPSQYGDRTEGGLPGRSRLRPRIQRALMAFLSRALCFLQEGSQRLSYGMLKRTK